MNMPRTQLSFRLIIGLVLTFSLALGGVTPVSAAQRCYVKAGAGGTGTSWANPYGNPQQALANAACAEIWVAKGIYKPTSGTDRFVSFTMKNGVALYGGFAGTETLLSQRKPALNLTILSGQIGALDQSDNSYHVVLGSGVNATAILDGFQVQDGFAANGLGGAGMLNTGNASPTLRNLTFTNNLATYGGGMYNENSSPSLSQVTFVGNSGTNGTGMYNFSNSNASLTDVAFTNNSASGGGGGLFNDSSSPILVNVTFSGNQANLGAGMFSQNAASSPSLTNVTFSGNIAATSGGGMYNYNSSTPNLRNVTISGNVSDDEGGGGGIYNDQSNPVITNSIVYPITRALYGKRIRQPIGGDFGLSGPLLARYLQHEDWETDVARFGIDIWMTTIAVAEGYRVCQSFLGAKLHDAKDPGSDLTAMLEQVVGSVFTLMSEYASAWSTRTGSEDVDLFGFRYDVGLDPIDVNLDRMLSAFRRGCEDLAEIWSIAFSPATLEDILRLSRTLDHPADFHLDDYLWTRIVYELASACHHRPMERRHLLQSLTPLYLARVGSFVIETRKMFAPEVEKRIEELCLCFEREKKTLIHRWMGSPSSGESPELRNAVPVPEWSREQHTEA